MSAPDRYAVFGSPIAHSRSPVIHKLFAEQTGQRLVYDKHLVEPEAFEEACREFFAAGGKGLNITLPLKELAFAYADRRTTRAEQAGAANTFKLEDDGKILADNTDGAGLVRDLRQNQGWDIAGKRVLILGAGGAVRGVLGPLLKETPEVVWIANRTVERAQTLADIFAEEGKVQSCGLDQIPAEAFDLVINGTSLGLHGERPPLSSAQLSSATACYDMAYGSEPTAFLRWAESQGVTKLADGLGMLVEQAAESFFLWRGVMPETAPVIAALCVD